MPALLHLLFSTSIVKIISFLSYIISGLFILPLLLFCPFVKNKTNAYHMIPNPVTTKNLSFCVADVGQYTQEALRISRFVISS